AGNTSGKVCLALEQIFNVGAVAPLFVALQFTSVCGTKTYTSAELRHMSDVPNQVVIRGDGTNGSVGVLGSAQDVVTDVRGSRHVVCTVAQNSGTSFFTAETPSNGGTLVGGIDASTTVVTVTGNHTGAGANQVLPVIIPGATITVDREAMLVTNAFLST